MLRDILQLLQKYDLPKIMGFVPNRLEITLERHSNDLFTLKYGEFFQYLPEDTLRTARENAIQLMQQQGVPLEEIHLVEQGVRVKMKSDFRIVLHLILELLIQIENNQACVKSHLDAIYQRYKTLVDLMDFYWHWNQDDQRTFEQLSTTLNKIMEENPMLYKELKEIFEKKSDPS